jgi:hypothetical protein
VSEQIPEPRSDFEAEGIPDLQDGTPERLWTEDPQEEPLPGDRPIGVDEYGTTAEERHEGEPLGDRLSRELPEEQPVFGVDESGGGLPLDTDDEVDSDVDPAWFGEAPEDEQTEARQAGRLVAPDEGAHEDAESTEVAQEAGPDFGAYSAEESAMHIEPD